MFENQVKGVKKCVKTKSGARIFLYPKADKNKGSYPIEVSQKLTLGDSLCNQELQEGSRRDEKVKFAGKIWFRRSQREKASNAARATLSGSSTLIRPVGTGRILFQVLVNLTAS